MRATVTGAGDRRSLSWLVTAVLALACPDGDDGGDDGASVSSSGAPSTEAGGAGAGGATSVANEAEAPPDVLPGFEIIQSGTDAGADGGTGADAGQAGTILTAPNWCERAGDEDQQLDVAIEIATDYVAAIQDDCNTAKLTASLNEAQVDDWSAYIVDYTLLWFYCPLEYNVPPGGIMVFGPGNVAAAGTSAAVFGADDVQRVTAHYVAAFAAHMQLTEPEAEGLGRYIEGTAVIDSSASALLSSCEASP